MPKTTVWCYVQGQCQPFDIFIEPNSTISKLQSLVYEKGKSSAFGGSFAKCSSLDLRVLKVDIKLADVIKEIRAGQFQLPRPSSHKFLNEWARISDTWQDTPPDRLQAFVFLPVFVQETSTLVNVIGGSPVNSDLVGSYRNLFIEVNNWGGFESSDIEANDVRLFNEESTPDFVMESELELDSKPCLERVEYDAVKYIKNTQFLDAYFGPLVLERSVEASSEEPESEPPRRTSDLELIHLAYIARVNWEQFWEGKMGGALEEMSMNAIFFHFFALVALQAGGGLTVRTSNHSWPFELIVRREATLEESRQLRKFRPRSDLLVSKNSLPRLFVEVNSKPKRDDRPEDLVRMLLMGAAVVRFANGFVARFKEARNFVLFAIYVWESGRVTRFSLFQEPNRSEVCYKEVTYWLNNSAGRAKFVRQLYNLLHMLESEEADDDAEEKIKLLRRMINKHEKIYNMKRFHNKTDTLRTSGTDSTKGKKRKRSQGAGGSAATDSADLVAHDYEVEEEPQDFVDETTSFSEMPSRPSHILSVFPRSDPSKALIAKKVRKGSPELEIFEYINSLQRKSEHVISLQDSFQTRSSSWVILPRMISLAGDVRLKGKVAQVCWGLIEGVAYLHEICVAHRDIKPHNLVLDKDYSLKIIDFDIAMRVQGDDEVVEGKCGTKGWTAPEIAEKSVYSPVKADRWSTGKVLLHLLERFGGRDTVLRATARKLMTYDPEQRPSMSQVARLSLSDVDVANVVLEEEDARSPRVKRWNKKRKLVPHDERAEFHGPQISRQPMFCV